MSPHGAYERINTICPSFAGGLNASRPGSLPSKPIAAFERSCPKSKPPDQCLRCQALDTDVRGVNAPAGSRMANCAPVHAIAERLGADHRSFPSAYPGHPLQSLPVWSDRDDMRWPGKISAKPAGAQNLRGLADAATCGRGGRVRGWTTTQAGLVTAASFRI